MKRRATATAAWTFCLAAVFTLCPCGLRGQGRDVVLAEYTKYEHEISMRDGVKLFTAVLHAERHLAAVSDPPHAHSLQRFSLRIRRFAQRPRSE
jgi:hypothetical protein